MNLVSWRHHFFLNFQIKIPFNNFGGVKLANVSWLPIGQVASHWLEELLGCRNNTPT
jgi:hypothetical protein